jgi:uncharacterized protein
VELLVLGLALAMMVVGMLGVVVPVMPGLLLVWLAACLSLLWQAGDATGWALVGMQTVLFALGTVATVYLPARTGRAGGLGARSAAITLLGAGLGFVLVPVIGLLLGAAVGLYLGERSRLGGHEAALASTGQVLRAYGVGVLVELLLGTVMIATWLVAVLLRL